MRKLSTIAVVDDDIGIREALDGLLRSLGHAPLTFCSAEEYLASPSRAAIDCMILDIRMPGLGGLELQAVLKSDDGQPPIIFLTSYGDEQTRARALAGGAVCFLSKPVNDEALIDCLRSALGEH